MKNECKMFKIEGITDPYENETLYWSNNMGWVNWKCSDTFRENETIRFPIGTCKIVFVDKNNHAL